MSAELIRLNQRDLRALRHCYYRHPRIISAATYRAIRKQCLERCMGWRHA